MRALICIVLATFLSGIPHAAAIEITNSEIIPTAVVIDELSRRRNSLQIEEFLERADVRVQLGELGLTREEINAKLATLSDTEIRQLAGEIKEARFGGELTGLLVVVVLILLIIFLAKRI